VTTPVPPSTTEQKGVTAAIERVIARSTVACIKNEFKWQWIGGSNESKKFKEEALTPGQGIKVYGFVREDSPIFQTVHGVGRFFDNEAPAKISGKPTAFIGDRTCFGEPRPVIPPPNAAWNWKATTVSEDETAWAVHQSEEQNKGKLWSRGGLATELTLPWLVYLPSIVAKYATEQPRTAYCMGGTSEPK
jgi:hypothetical protein